MYLQWALDGFRARDANYKMLSEMIKFGLKRVSIGIESANDGILENIKKEEKLHHIENCIELLKALHISVVTFFIIGLPGETRKHVLNSFKFILKYPNISYAYFFKPYPIPGTELYKWAEINNSLRTTKQQFYYNIGGIGKDILIETPELSVKERKMLYMLSKVISKLVTLRYKIYKLLNRCRELSKNLTAMKS